MNDILEVPYSQTGATVLGVETLSLEELQQRACVADLAQVQRIQFFLLLLFTEGEGEHMVDFVAYPIRPRTLMLVKPGQVQQWQINPTFNAQLIVIDPSFLLPERMNADGTPPRLWWPPHTELPDDLAQQFLAIADGIFADSARYAPHPLRRTLLQHRLYTLLLLLRLFHDGAPSSETSSKAYNLVNRYKQLVEEGYAVHRSVTYYAERLGCAEKTLTRACQLIEGTAAKAILDKRIVLEAKRLLAHSRDSVAHISQQLGFSETTNFIRFFKKREEVTPATFRDRHTRPN